MFKIRNGNGNSKIKEIEMVMQAKTIDNSMVVSYLFLKECHQMFRLCNKLITTCPVKRLKQGIVISTTYITNTSLNAKQW